MLIANITGIGYPAATAPGRPGSSKYARLPVKKVANAVLGPVVNQVAAIAGDALSCITRPRLGTCLGAAAAVLPYLVGDGEAAALTGTTAAEEGGRGLVNLASDARTQHILHGDETCGGHLWPGLSGEAPFPQGWSAEQVGMHAVSDIATDPAAWERAVKQGSRTVLVGTQNGVEIRDRMGRSPSTGSHVPRG